MQERFGGVGAVVGGVLVVLVMLIVALLYWVGLKLASGELTYKQAFSVSLYASVPVVIQQLLGGLIIFRRQSLSLDELTTRNFLASNLAFAPPATIDG